MPIYYYPSFSSQYLLYLLGILIVLYAQGRVSSAYNKYKQIPNKKGIRGVDAARIILEMVYRMYVSNQRKAEH